MQATFLSERQRHIMPIHWDASSKDVYPYTYGALAIVVVHTSYRTVSAIPCLERRLTPVGETFWSLAYRSTPPVEYQPVCVKFSAGSEPKLDYELLVPASGHTKLLLAETPEQWPDTLDGSVRDVAGRLVDVPLAPRLLRESSVGDGLAIVRSYALHRAKAVLRLEIDGHAYPRDELEIPSLRLHWGAFEKELRMSEVEPDPRAEIGS